MSARRIAPQSDRPGSSRWPGLRRKKVTLDVASTATPRTLPVAPSRPEGTSTATTRPPPRAKALIRSTIVRASPSMSRARPAPKRASIDAVRAAESDVRGGRHAARRSGRRRSRRRRGAPRAGRGGRVRPDSRARASSRAATKPSPPLLPGPQRTTIRPRERASRAASSATASPARLHQRDARAFRPRSSSGRPRPSRQGSGVPGSFSGSSMPARWRARLRRASDKNDFASRQILLYRAPR